MKKKIWIALVCVTPVILTCILVAGLYLAVSSPSACKAAFEWGVPRFTHAPATVERVALSWQPFKLRLEKLRLGLDGKEPANYLEVDEIDLYLALAGSFGKKTLWINDLTIRHPKVNLISDLPVGQGSPPSPRSSAPGFFSRLLSALVFQDIRMKSIAVLNGEAVRVVDGLNARLSNIDLRIDPEMTFTGVMNAAVHDQGQEIELTGILCDVSGKLSPLDQPFQLSGDIRLLADRIAAKGIALSDLKSRTQVVYDSDNQKIGIKEFKISATVAKLPQAEAQQFLPKQISAQVDADLDLSRMQLTKAAWFFSVDDLVFLKGDAAARLKESVHFEVSVAEGKLHLEALNRLLSKEIAAKQMRFDIKEAVGLDGRFLIHSDEGTYRLDGKLNLNLRDNPYYLENDTIAVHGNLDGRITISATLPGNLDFEGALKNRVQRLSSGAIDLKAATAGIQFKGRYPKMSVKEARIQIPMVELPLASEKSTLKNLTVRAVNAELDLASLSGRLPAVYIDSEQLKSILLGVTQTPGATVVTVRADQSGLLKSLAESGLLPEGWQIAANDVLTARLQYDAKKNIVQWQAGLDLNDLKLNNPDQSIVSEKVSLKFNSNGKMMLNEQRIDSDFNLSCGGGEALLDRYYLNFQDHPINLEGKVTYAAPEAELALSGGLFEIKGLIRAGVDMQRHFFNGDSGWRVQVALPETDVAPLYQFGLKEPFVLESPVLESLQIDGTIKADADFNLKNNQWDLNGILSWANGSLDLSEKNIRLQSVQLNLPLQISSKPEVRKVLPQDGNLSVGKLNAPFLAEQALAVAFQITPNHLSIAQPIALQAQGGGLIRVRPLAAGFEMETGLEIDTALDIEQWRFDAGLERWWPSQGPLTINATLDSIKVEKERVTTSGALLTQAFGGVVRVNNPRAGQLFSSAPVLGADIEISGINLAALTNQTSFGRIDGRLDGSIKNLEMVNGQPQRFYSQLETVSQRGMPQKISVKAVESIARIGGGQSPFMGLAGNIATLFKKFGYRKIGIKADLENDMFKVNGLVREKGLEYLVKKSGLSGVDVVNSNPDNRIGFKDMVKRIQRVLNPHAGPVVQ